MKGSSLDGLRASSARGRGAAVHLFIDVETADAPPRRGTRVTDTNAWPRLVQLGWVATDDGGRELAAHEFLVRPDGFRIALGAEGIHGISTAMALRDGVPLASALAAFADAVHGAEVLVAHNFSFDQPVLLVEYARTGLAWPEGRRRHVCTMEGSANYCRLPGNYGYKWPRLDELHRTLFGESFEGAHGALADARACMRCFFRLAERGVNL